MNWPAIDGMSSYGQMVFCKHVWETFKNIVLGELRRPFPTYMLTDIVQATLSFSTIKCEPKFVEALECHLSIAAFEGQTESIEDFHIIEGVDPNSIYFIRPAEDACYIVDEVQGIDVREFKGRYIDTMTDIIMKSIENEPTSEENSQYGQFETDFIKRYAGG